MSVIPQIYTLSESTNVVQSGYLPLLFTVAAGSYASNSYFGAGAPEQKDYSSVQYKSGTSNVTFAPTYPNQYAPSLTQVNFRKEDVTIDFTMAITLNGTVANPISDGPSQTQELRIRTMPITQGQPFTYLAVLPEMSYGFGAPLFSVVEVLDKNNNLLLPSQSGSILTARLLSDQTIALLRINLTSSPTSYVPLTVADLTGTNVWGTNNLIYILVRGSYYAAN